MTCRDRIAGLLLALAIGGALGWALAEFVTPDEPATEIDIGSLA